VVRSKYGEQVLEQPYQSVRLQNGNLTATTVTETEIQARFGDTLAHLPHKPLQFIFYFPEGSSALTQDSQQQLPLLRQALDRYPATEILIVGHTDTVGDALANDALSMQRAQAMRDILEAEGFGEQARIELAGRGEREPLIETADEVREPRNRRVVVHVR
jgi:outer membrane protein OmpA-like peptidoglycan-associated protein